MSRFSWLAAAVLCAAVCIMADPGTGEEPAASGPPGEEWLELAVGADEYALFRHHFHANLLAQAQALVWDKPAPGQKAPLYVLDGSLVVRRGRRMWLDLSRVEHDTGAELRRGPPAL